MKKYIKYSIAIEENDLFKSLINQVNHSLSKVPNKSKMLLLAKVRAISFPLLFIVLYLASVLYFHSVLLFFFCYAFMGIVIVLSFLNLIHELVHGTLFKNKRINKFLLYFFDIIGANSYIWKKRHTILHHGFPNVAGWDSDIEQATFFKIFPHGDSKSIQRYQHWYFVFLYPFYLVNWVFVRDFKDFLNKKQIVRKVCAIPVIEYVKLFFFKFFFIFYTVVIPALFFSINWKFSFLAMITMLMVAGIFALIVLLTPHVNIGNDFPIANEGGYLPHSWFKHQLQTTNDVSSSSWFTRNLMGNFNFHIAHHLFPGQPNVFAPYITDVIQEFAKNHNLPYRTYPLKIALRYHFELIRNNAIGAEILEEDM